MKRIGLSLLACALASFAFAGCTRNLKPEVTTPTGPCLDTENLDNGRCTPRFPGEGQTPHNGNIGP